MEEGEESLESEDEGLYMGSSTFVEPSKRWKLEGLHSKFHEIVVCGVEVYNVYTMSESIVCAKNWRRLVGLKNKCLFELSP